MKLLPIFMTLLLFSCGKGKSSKAEETLTLPTTFGESETRAPKNYPYACKPVDEVQGGNYDFFWSFPMPGEVEELKLNPDKKFLKIKYLGSEEEYISRMNQRENAFESGNYRAEVPELPSGTIRGRRKEYTIVELYFEGNEIQKFLCPRSLKNETSP